MLSAILRIKCWNAGSGITARNKNRLHIGQGTLPSGAALTALCDYHQLTHYMQESLDKYVDYSCSGATYFIP